MRDSFAEQTEANWEQIKPLWGAQKPGLRHEDHTFGQLLCHQLNDLSFLLTYEGWRIKLEPEQAQIDIQAGGNDSTIDEQYVIERLAMPFLRLIRGAVLWHAGAVAIQNKVYAFLAPSGIGKTTLTATMLATFSSCQMLCDDILAIVPDISNKSALCLPSCSHLAMRHELFDRHEFVEHTVMLGHKHLLFIKPEKCRHTPGTLESVYLLQPGHRHVPEKINLPRAISTLLNQQMMMAMLPLEIRRYQFKACMQIIQSCSSFYQLEVAPDAWHDISHRVYEGFQGNSVSVSDEKSTP